LNYVEAYSYTQNESTHHFKYSIGFRPVARVMKKERNEIKKE